MSKFLAHDDARILVIDDNHTIHECFREILTPASEQQPGARSVPDAAADSCELELHSAYQGREGWNLLRQARAQGRSYAMAFVDVRMPPGWDGLQTVARLWEEDADLQIVLCSGYSDYSWTQVVQRLGARDRLRVLNKPFEVATVRQLTRTLLTKWRYARQSRFRAADPESRFAEQTREILVGIAASRRLNAEYAPSRDHDRG